MSEATGYNEEKMYCETCATDISMEELSSHFDHLLYFMDNEVKETANQQRADKQNACFKMSCTCTGRPDENGVANESSHSNKMSEPTKKNGGWIKKAYSKFKKVFNKKKEAY